MAIIDEIISTLRNILGIPKKKRRRSSKGNPLRKKKTVAAKLKTKKVVKKTAKNKKPVKKTSSQSSPQKPKTPKKVASKKAGTAKRKVKKPPAKKKVATTKKKKKVAAKPLKGTVAKTKKTNEVLIGEITHYFNKIMVGVVKMTYGPMKVKDMILIEGKTTSFKQKILSLQVESLDVRMAEKGQLAGLKVRKPIKVGDKVYKV
ncbi:MAG: hypothetical protein KAR05_12255 [Candidatus Omnitrophica bacterium]|nr:hypothetical protein [Candidatus Omnitrophota bacterium]